MSDIRGEIKKAKESAHLYKVIKIDPYVSCEGNLYVLHSDEIQETCYSNSTTSFGHWLELKKCKIDDKVRLSITQGGEIAYAELVD